MEQLIQEVVSQQKSARGDGMREVMVTYVRVFTFLPIAVYTRGFLFFTLNKQLKRFTFFLL